jgi:hypothetical protein
MTMPIDPVKAYSDDDGYNYVETSPDWQAACSVLPSFSAVHWPGYETSVVEDNIHGQAVVIQLWKGRCQRFFGLSNFPGGIGAEVAVYQRMPGRPLPTALPTLSSKIEGLLLSFLPELGEDLWWPVTKLDTRIDFELVNPKTNTTFFSAGPETTYWMNKWMRPDSYRLYEEENKPLPFLTEDYKLNYRINGKSYSW